LVVPGAMLRTPLAAWAEAAPVMPAPIENELAVQTELSLLTIVTAKLVAFGYTVLLLVGLRLTVGGATWQTGSTRVTVKFELSWTVCDGFDRIAFALIEYVLLVAGAEVGVTVTVVTLVVWGATDNDEAVLVEMFPAVWPLSAALAVMEKDVAVQALLSLLVTETV
jgi:hypothetical protein